jgi:hypothetical protein
MARKKNLQKAREQITKDLEQQEKKEKKLERNLYDVTDKYAKFRFNEDKLASECLKVVLQDFDEVKNDNKGNISQEIRVEYLDIVFKIFSLIHLLFTNYKNQLQNSFLNPKFIFYVMYFLDETNDYITEDLDKKKEITERVFSQTNKENNTIQMIRLERYKNYIKNKLDSLKRSSGRKILYVYERVDSNTDGFFPDFNFRKFWRDNSINWKIHEF